MRQRSRDGQAIQSIPPRLARQVCCEDGDRRSTERGRPIGTRAHRPSSESIRARQPAYENHPKTAQKRVICPAETAILGKKPLPDPGAPAAGAPPAAGGRSPAGTARGGMVPSPCPATQIPTFGRSPGQPNHPSLLYLREIPPPRSSGDFLGLWAHCFEILPTPHCIVRNHGFLARKRPFSEFRAHGSPRVQVQVREPCNFAKTATKLAICPAETPILRKKPIPDRGAPA